MDPKDCSVVWPVFNTGWNLVAGNQKGQNHQPLTAEQGAGQRARYLEYLARGIASFARHHASFGDLAVPLVQLAEDGLQPADVERWLATRVPEIAPRVRVEPIPIARARPFIDEARALPPDQYRPPNRLHESVLLDLIRTARHPWLAIVDTDVTFLARDALWRIGASLESREEKWIGAFLEAGRERPPGDPRPPMRERMHSVLLFVKTKPLSSFPFAPFLRPSGFEERVSVLRDERLRDLYRRSGFVERSRTLSFLTEWLRQDEDRVLDLSKVIERYHEGELLTLVSDWLIHAKYLEPQAVAPIRRAIEADPAWVRNPELEAFVRALAR